MKHLSKLKGVALVAILVTAGIPAQGQWEYKAPLYKARAFAATEVIGQKIYVIGGAISRTESTATMEVYDYANDQWDTTRASLPVPLCAAASTVLDGKIYVMGGKTTYEGSDWHNEVYEYDPVNDKWQKLLYSMQTRRAFFSACTLGGEIYAVGGRTVNAFSITTVEKFNPSKGWTTIASLNAARSNLTAETLHGVVYAIAGVDAINPTSVEKYDPAAGAKWTLTGEQIDRYLHGSTAWGGNIYMVGGLTSGNPNPLPDLVRYNPATGFTTLPCPLQEIKAACGTVVVEDSLAAIGGRLFAIGGVLVPFFLPAEPGPAVSASVLMYCEPFVAAKEEMVEAASLALSQNTPNPFAGQTTIGYELQRPADIRIQVFDLNGQVVATLRDERQEPGRYSIRWDAAGVPDGVYLCQLKSDTGALVKKCILINY